MLEAQKTDLQTRDWHQDYFGRPLAAAAAALAGRFAGIEADWERLAPK